MRDIHLPMVYEAEETLEVKELHPLKHYDWVLVRRDVLEQVSEVVTACAEQDSMSPNVGAFSRQRYVHEFSTLEQRLERSYNI